MRSELPHSGNKAGQRFPFVTLIAMQSRVNVMYALRIDSIAKFIEAGMREVRVHGQVMFTSDLLAQLNEVRINGRLASGDMQEPPLAGGVERVKPL